MLPFIYFIFATAILAGIIYIGYKLNSRTDIQENLREKDRLVDENAQLRASLNQKSEDVGSLQSHLAIEKTEKDRLSGTNKEMFASNTMLKAEVQKLRDQNDDLKQRVTAFEIEQKRREKDFEQKLTQLQHAEQSFKDERARIIREDEEKLKQEAEERDRTWKDHENKVIAHLADLCQQPQYLFKSYTNERLPEGFVGDLAPDFMIDFLGQYIVFDAKVSKSKNLQTYINDQLKKTVDKVKNNDQIFSSIFLVVPTQAISELKKHHYTLDGYTFYVISPESIPPILASLKRISEYELAEQLDPRQRENIVTLISELDYHINLRNATDIFMSKLGTSILEMAQNLEPSMAAEIDIKKQEKKSPFQQSEIKKMILSTELQDKEINRIVSPKVSIKKKDIENIKSILTEHVVEESFKTMLKAEKAEDVIQKLL